MGLSHLVPITYCNNYVVFVLFYVTDYIYLHICMLPPPCRKGVIWVVQWLRWLWYRCVSILQVTGVAHLLKRPLYITMIYVCGHACTYPHIIITDQWLQFVFLSVLLDHHVMINAHMCVVVRIHDIPWALHTPYLKSALCMIRCSIIVVYIRNYNNVRSTPACI